MNKPPLTSIDKAPMLSSLKTDAGRGLLGDLCGTNYAKRGSLWGYGLSSTHKAFASPSMFGSFNDDNGNTVVIVWDHVPAFATIVREMQLKFDGVVLYTSDAYEKGSRNTQAAIKAVAGIDPLVLLWNATTHGDGWAENAADHIKHRVLDTLPTVAGNARGKRFLVVLHREEPYKWQDFAAQFIVYVGVVAQLVPGLPKDIISKASQTLNQYLTTGRVNIDAVIACAMALAPDSVRKSEYVQRGTKVYGSIKNNDWLGAAKAVGVDVPGLLKNFADSTDWTAIAKTATTGFDSAVSSLQNFLNADAVNKFAGGIRSGKIIMDLVSGGSVTTVKEFQDAILGGINTQTLMTLLPQPYALAKSIINETNDIKNSDEFRAILGLGSGIAVGVNVLDDLSVRSIAARVNDVLANRYASGIKDLQYALTTAIAPDKREFFATEVSKLTGAQVLTNPRDVSVSSNLRRALPYIAIGGAAVGAAYFYRKDIQRVI